MFAKPTKSKRVQMVRGKIEHQKIFQGYLWVLKIVPGMKFCSPESRISVAWTLLVENIQILHAHSYKFESENSWDLEG